MVVLFLSPEKQRRKRKMTNNITLIDRAAAEEIHKNNDDIEDAKEWRINLTAQIIADARALEKAPKLEGDVGEIRGLPSLLRRQAHYEMGPGFRLSSEIMEKAADTIEALSEHLKCAEWAHDTAGR